MAKQKTYEYRATVTIMVKGIARRDTARQIARDILKDAAIGYDYGDATAKMLPGPLSAAIKKT